jgi:glucose-1-phosphate adenylyltransferase
MVAQHTESGAAVTVAAIRAPIEQADQFGVIEAADDGRTIAAFREKPKDAKPLADAPDQVYASMGNYVFTTEALMEAVSADAADEDSKHDIGGNIIPMLVARGEAEVYDFAANEVPGATDRDRSYWRDVGTLDAYYEANMDLLKPVPPIDLYQGDWPIRTYEGQHPPARSVPGRSGREAEIVNCMLASGTLIVGGTLRHTILFPSVRVEQGAVVEHSLLFEGVIVEEGAHLHRCIVDKDVKIPAGERIGFDRAADAMRFTVTEGGIVVIPKSYCFSVPV